MQPTSVINLKTFISEMKPININVGILRNSCRQQINTVNPFPNVPIVSSTIEKIEKNLFLSTFTKSIIIFCFIKMR